MSLEVESMARRKFEATQDGSQKKVKLEPQGAGVCDNKLFMRNVLRHCGQQPV